MLSSTILCCLPVVVLLISPLQAQVAQQSELQRQLIMAEDGSTITISPGTWQVSSTIVLEGKKNITLRGSGMGITILSFKDQPENTEGIRIINAKDITVRDLTITDTRGDAIRATGVNGISFIRVAVTWSGKPSKDNGAYGFCPVQCQQVLIDSCSATGASDAGIHVGQSKDVIIRNSLTKNNVAGIEIENSLNTQVYENEATGNTGGILIFDLPGLEQKKGGNVKIFRNNIHHNNFPNFAPKDNIPGKIPQGSGIIILATSDVHVYDNTIHYNNSMGTAILSYYLTENPISDSAYVPYPAAVYIHDNDYLREPVKFQGKGLFGAIFRLKLRFGKNVPHIIFDGILNQAWVDDKGSYRTGYRICIGANRNVSFANLDAANNFRNISRDMSAYTCSPPSDIITGRSMLAANRR